MKPTVVCQPVSKLGMFTFFFIYNSFHCAFFSKMRNQTRFLDLWWDPVDTGCKLNVHRTFRRRPGRPLNVLCTFNLRPVSTGKKEAVFKGEG